MVPFLDKSEFGIIKSVNSLLVSLQIRRLGLTFSLMEKLPSIFLDSGGGWLGDKTKKHSYIMFESPVHTLSFKDGVSTIISGGKKVESKRDPFQLLDGYLADGYAAAGYIGYEYSKYTDSGFKPELKKEGDRLPDICLNIYDIKNVKENDASQLKYDLSAIKQKKNTQSHIEDIKYISNMSQSAYEDMVSKVMSYISTGDIYQANVSQRFKTHLESDALDCFLRLYEAQPVPFGSYMDFGEFQIVSGSMELFLRRDGNRLLTKPIKGTRKRGRTEELDTVKKAELISSDKERAENLMIVDLMRNDLGRISKRGSVKVNSLFDVETYSTLHQMVSEIESTLSDDIRIADIVSNVFPPGSVTGAPKKRTLEVIDELEPHLRGPYCGTLGVFYPDGDFVLSVGIRLMVTKGHEATFWVGGGIVWDSEPDKEYEETILKSYAIRKALGTIE